MASFAVHSNIIVELRNINELQNLILFLDL